ncbi:MAG: hypothetical protein ACE5HQ_12080 [Gemmatimonadota bacterium]
MTTGPGCLRRSGLILLPSTHRDRRFLLPVARGRVLPEREMSLIPGRWERVVEDAAYAVRVAELGATGVFPSRELIPAMIVLRWIDTGAREGLVLDLDRVGSAEAVERIREAAASCAEDPAPKRRSGGPAAAVAL